MTTTDFTKCETEIVKHGAKIVLPSEPREMTEDEAIDQLKRKKQQASMDVEIFEEIDCFPLEGAYALQQCLRAKYGWVNSVITPGKSMFEGPRPPTMVTLETAYGEYSQVLWGSFEVPGVDGRLETGAKRKKSQPIFLIAGTVKKRFQAQVLELANDVREYVKKNSLYKGQAVKISTYEAGQGEYIMDMTEPPKFIDLTKVNEEELVFSDDLKYQVETNLFTPIEKTDLCREHGVPLKRGVLLEGPYGTGKTLTAFVAAKKAVANGWTFIYLDRVSAIKEALIFARKYSPAIIFAEDIERVVTGSDRTVSIDDVLNNIDGLDSKNQEVLTIFTTNHVDQISKAMLRPGRLDAVITVSPPDAAAAEKLVRVYARELIDAKEKLKDACLELKGQIPATIREVVERAKLYAIGRLQKGEKLKLTGEDIRRSAIGMKGHLDILSPKVEAPKTAVQTFGESMVKVFNETLEGSRMMNNVEEIRNQLN